MQSHNDDVISANNTHDSEPNKLTAAAGSKLRLRFYGNGDYAFINIDPSIIGKLHLTEQDTFTQEIVNDGIFLKRWKA